MNCKVIQTFCIITTIFCQSIWALSGTGGTPLGGMGTGYVMFDGQKIRVSSRMPPAAVDHAEMGGTRGQAEKQISASGFYLFAGGTAKPQVKAASEDAKCPVQLADLGAISDVKFTLKAFGPYWPGEGEQKYKLATSPMALFDVTAVNSGSAAADVAVALEIALGSGGKVESGNKAVSFAGSGENSYLAVDCDGTTPTFTAGAKGTFETDGKLANADGNLVGAKCNIPAGGTVHFKFVLAWYTADYGDEDYYYHNFYKNSKDVADTGISNFDGIRDGITGFVDRVMASNFPDWYKDRLLNNTYPLIHNSVCAKDGRVAFWEGEYGIIGTIDQGQHAAVFYTFNWPNIQWQELKYWIGQQKSSGQIHHDFNQGTQKFTPGSTAGNRHLLELTNKNHQDYWWFPNTDTWSDLNSMFLFKAYELVLATGDVKQLKDNWDPILKSANRLIAQCNSSKIPLNAHSTYDQRKQGATGNAPSDFEETPQYCASVALTTYQAVSEMAKLVGDDATATKFTQQYDGGRAEFAQKYSNDANFGTHYQFSECHIAGYSWANYFSLKPIMDNNWITSTLSKMRSKQQSGNVRTMGDWIFYNVDHYGGAEIAINQPDAAMRIHKLDYDEYYKNNPSEVHWQSLQKSAGPRGHDSYMTAPTVWHSYFQFCGYMIDNANNRLWIRPRIPSDMKGKITNAVLLNPKALGTLDYDENADEATGVTQTITVKYDKPVTIKEFVLKNNTGIDAPFVAITGVSNPTIKTEGADPEKNIRVTLSTPIEIGPNGVKIQVSKKAVSTANTKWLSISIPLSVNSSNLFAGKALYYSVNAAGPVKMELLSINGAKIGTIMSKSLSAGNHSFVWNGKTIEGRNVGSAFAVLRLSSANGTVTKMVSVAR